MANAADPANKADIIARERRAWTNWWSHVADVDPAAIRPDGWSLKDVIAHLSGRQRHSSDRLATLGGEEPDPGPPETDVFNEQVREEALSRSWWDVRSEAEGNRGRNHPVYAAGKACSRAGGPTPPAEPVSRSSLHTSCSAPSTSAKEWGPRSSISSKSLGMTFDGNPRPPDD